jgi:V/A-type H+-transporting ATPase subunit A
MEAARSIREDFLHQLAYHEIDTYTSLEKQMHMMRLILAYYDFAAQALEQGVDVEAIAALPVRESIGRFKYIPEENTADEFETVNAKLKTEISALLKGGDR